MVGPHRRAAALLCSASVESGEDSAAEEPILSINPALDFSLPYRVLAFYVIAPVAAPDKAVEEHRRFLSTWTGALRKRAKTM